MSNSLLSSAIALSCFRQVKSAADEEAKNKWPYVIFEQWRKERLIKQYQLASLTSRFANTQFANNQSRLANVFGSFATVLLASNRSRASM